MLLHKHFPITYNHSQRLSLENNYTFNKTQNIATYYTYFKKVLSSNYSNLSSRGFEKNKTLNKSDPFSFMTNARKNPNV